MGVVRGEDGRGSRGERDRNRLPLLHGEYRRCNQGHGLEGKMSAIDLTELADQHIVRGNPRRSL